MPHEKNEFKSLYWSAVSIIVLCCVIAAGIAMYFLIAQSQHLHRGDAWLALLGGCITAGLTYLLTSYCLQKAKALSRKDELTAFVVNPIIAKLDGARPVVYTKVGEINWDTLFDHDTKEIHLLVQGWDKWQDKVAEYLPEFLLRGGVVHLMQHDPNNEQLLEFMSQRMPEKDVRKEIENTQKNLRKVIRDVVGEDKLAMHFQCYYIQRVNWYCGIYFKPTKLLLSLYQHRPFNDVDRLKAPSFVIRKGDPSFDSVRDWFEQDWRSLLESRAEHNEV